MKTQLILVTTPVTDCSSTDKVESVNVQTRTWYLLPHSVTTYRVAYNGQLYPTSVIGRRSRTLTAGAGTRT
jgi:hypothetical protein